MALKLIDKDAQLPGGYVGCKFSYFSTSGGDSGTLKPDLCSNSATIQLTDPLGVSNITYEDFKNWQFTALTDTYTCVYGATSTRDVASMGPVSVPVTASTTAYGTFLNYTGDFEASGGISVPDTGHHRFFFNLFYGPWAYNSSAQARAADWEKVWAGYTPDLSMLPAVRDGTGANSAMPDDNSGYSITYLGGYPRSRDYTNAPAWVIRMGRNDYLENDLADVADKAPNGGALDLYVPE
jgi:hypothetical protein